MAEQRYLLSNSRAAPLNPDRVEHVLESGSELGLLNMSYPGLCVPIIILLETDHIGIHFKNLFIQSINKTWLGWGKNLLYNKDLRKKAILDPRNQNIDFREKSLILKLFVW